MDPVRVAIIGMGIGRPNAKAIAADPRGRVVALCDLFEDRMKDFAKDLPQPIRFFTDYKALCRDKEIDAIFIGSPNQMHVPMGVEAVRNGKHVLITKPLADSDAAAAKLVKAAESAGVVNMMSLSTRFGGEAIYMESQKKAGVFGDIYYGRARSIRRSGIPGWSLGFLKKGGGAFRDMGVHALDAAWWLMGRPRALTATGVGGAKFGPHGEGYWDYRKMPAKTYKQFKADDYAGGFIRFEGGAGLQIESFWASHQPDEFQIELFGTKAGAKVYPPTLYQTRANAPLTTTVALPKGPTAWDNIARHFIDCILDGVKCEAPLRDGLAVQRMLEAVLKSSETGREVRL